MLSIFTLLGCFIFVKCQYGVGPGSGNIGYGRPAPCFEVLQNGVPFLVRGCMLTPTVRYYFDAVMGDCLNFTFVGCGGNSNNFPTRQACLETCFNPQLLKPGGILVGDDRICIDNRDCTIGAWCVSNRCECMNDYALVTREKRCFRKIQPGEPGCYYSEQCNLAYTSSVCTGGYCSCPPGTFQENTYRSCSTQIGITLNGQGLYGDPCTKSNECSPGMFCDTQYRVCKCTGAFIASASRTCERRLVGGFSSCKNNDQCAFSIPDSQCIDNICQCSSTKKPFQQLGGNVMCVDKASWSG